MADVIALSARRTSLGFIIVDGAGDFVASVPITTGDHGADEQTAYAKLFAASPELLAASKGMLQEWEKLSRYGSPIAKAANQNVNRLIGAIARAEGRT